MLHWLGRHNLTLLLSALTTPDSLLPSAVSDRVCFMSLQQEGGGQGSGVYEGLALKGLICLDVSVDNVSVLQVPSVPQDLAVVSFP